MGAAIVQSMLAPEIGPSLCNVRAIRYKRTLFFLWIAATRIVSFVAASFTSMFAMVPRSCMLPRSCVAAHMWCLAHVPPRTRMLPLIYGAAFVYAAARLCSRASVVPRTLILPRPMVPRGRPNGLRFSVLPRPMVPRGRPNGLRFSVLPRPMVPRGRPNGVWFSGCRVPWCRAGGQMVSGSLCCRVPWCRACGQTVSVLCAAASHVPRGRPNGLSSLCCRVPWCRAVLHVAAFHAAAPRSLVPLSLRVAALHGAARGTTHRVFALLPRGGLDCYKRAARSTVGVSCSTAVVEVGRLRIDVEVSRSAALVKYGCATVVVEKRCCIFDVGIKFDNRRSGFIRSSNQRSYWIVVWDWRHSFTYRLRIKSHRLHIRPRIVLVLFGRTSSQNCRASSTCCHASQHTAAHRKDLFGRYCTFVLRGKILSLLPQISE